MKRENLLITITGAVLSVFILAMPLPAADFEVTKVIEIGPADRVPFMWPVKWSPDGTRLSYFKDNWLMISDTLGHGRPIYEATMHPQRYEWLSEHEIVLLQLGRLNAGKATKISIIDLETGQEKIIIDKKEKFREADENDSTFFDGPRISIEGNVYYSMEKRSGTKTGIPKSEYANKNYAEILATNHYLSWGADGLYKIKLDRTDSLRIGPKPYAYMPMPPTMSDDGEFIFVGGTMLRLRDSTYLVIDTMFRTKPPKTVECGILIGSLSNEFSELLFQRSCDDGESYNVLSIWTLDLGTGIQKNLDTLSGLRECNSPRYSPDKLSISCLSRGKAYIIKRRLLQ